MIDNVGAPPQWTPATLPVVLPKDSGAYFIDQNGYEVPSSPFEPLFSALRIMRPSFDFTAVDLLANRNSLRKLLSFTSNKVTDSFRIDLHMVRGTLIMVRRERSMRHIIQGSKNSGHGHTFEAAFTTPEKGLEGSLGHHRVINYVLGDLNCVVEFEVDAWYDAGETGTSVPSDPDEGLLSSLTNLSLGESAPQKHPPPASTNLLVIQHGRNIPSSKLAEIKTCGPNSPQMNKLMPQLWFGRTPYLLVGMHEKGSGVFNRVKIIDVAAKFSEWEKQNQDPLRTLSRLIAELKRLSSETEDGSCIITCEHTIKPPRLEIFARSKAGKKFDLPDEFVHMFWKETTT